VCDMGALYENGVYRMWYTWRTTKSIALAESVDGIHWSDPKIVLGPQDTIEGWQDELNRPYVLFHDGQYHMWYTTQKQGKINHMIDGRSWIFYATSPDGVKWKRIGREPVLSPEEPWEKMNLMCPSVLWDEDLQLYRMWYSGGEYWEPNAIGYATSPDGINWTKYSENPVFFTSTSRDWERAAQYRIENCPPDQIWEQHKVAGVQIIKKDDWYIMFYIGYWDEDTAQIGIARSRDGITNWERNPHNPIIAPTKGTWDRDCCYKPFAIFDGKRWLLWYNGREIWVEQIGVVFHEGEDLGFE